MLRQAKLTALAGFRSAGAFRWAQTSDWRRDRLLILCYHGVSLDDEHEWDGGLFMSQDRLRERLEAIRAAGLAVRPLGEAISDLQEGRLDEPTAAITFDDGFHDFSARAAPVLREFGYPATVYLTTYYVDYQKPIFNLVCPYMLWKQRDSRIRLGGELGFGEPVELQGENWREAGSQLVASAAKEGLSAEEKDEKAQRLADALSLDYEGLVASRRLQLLSPPEVTELAREGFDFQLHTHRHRTPMDERLYRREIAENRQRIASMTGREPVHFCYPSGVYRPENLPWLHAEGVATATTCDAGLATRDTEALLLPRKVDTMVVTQVEFEAWLTGFEPLIRRL